MGNATKRKQLNNGQCNKNTGTLGNATKPVEHWAMQQRKTVEQWAMQKNKSS